MKGGEKQLGKKQMIPILETKRNSGLCGGGSSYQPPGGDEGLGEQGGEE